MFFNQKKNQGGRIAKSKPFPSANESRSKVWLNSRKRGGFVS